MTDVLRQEESAPAESRTSSPLPAAEAGAESYRGRTLVSLLDEAVRRNPNPNAFNQLRDGKWETMSTALFSTRSEELALGLSELGLERGDRVAFFALNDISFTLPDMACCMAGLVTVPIYLTHAPSNISYILRQSGATTLVVTNRELLGHLAASLPGSEVKTVMVMEGDLEGTDLPGLQVVHSDEVASRGRKRLEAEPSAGTQLKSALSPSDLATIIYTSGTTGTPKGVMLSHENVASNTIASFTALTGFERGAQEVSISFLPLTHIFARTLQYGTMWYGNTTYFSDPERLSEHFREVRPTMLATVPRVLERAYERILAAGSELPGTKRILFDWSLSLARKYRVEEPPVGVAAIQYRVADKLVFSKWREALGGRMRFVIVGAAALRPELVNIFGAAGINVLQGYGLTESSPVISFNRPELNRPGTVGVPIPGVEVATGSDGEILARGPNIMLGYYRNEIESARTIVDGWLHTGDLGHIDSDGYITLTGRLKNLFKLSTGKYVMPQPIEQKLEAEQLIEHALVVGEGEKYCAALLILNADALDAFAQERKLAGEPGSVLSNDDLHGRLRRSLLEANSDLPEWSCVKRALVTVQEVSIDNGLLTPTLKLRREPVLEVHEELIERLYRPGETELPGNVSVIEL